MISGQLLEVLDNDVSVEKKEKAFKGSISISIQSCSTKYEFTPFRSKDS